MEKLKEFGQRLNAHLEREMKQQQRIIAKEIICAPEQGLVLGENDEKDVDERLTESLTNYGENEDQHEEMVQKIPNEANEPYGFKINKLLQIRDRELVAFCTKRKNNH